MIKLSDEFNFKNMTSEELSNSKNSNSKITINKSAYNQMLVAIIVATAFAAFFGGLSIGNLVYVDSGVSGEEIKEILSEIQENQNQAQPTIQPTQPSAPQTIQISLDDDPLKGNPNAPITVVEFSDFECPFCSRFFTNTLPQLQENYIDTGKINLVYRDLPLENIHSNAKPAHIAAECADEQNSFWEYHDKLFANQSNWNRLDHTELNNLLLQYAQEMGLDQISFETCLKSENILSEISKDVLDASEYGATGTPTFFIGNEKDGYVKLVGAQPYSSFQRIIDEQLS